MTSKDEMLVVLKSKILDVNNTAIKLKQIKQLYAKVKKAEVVTPDIEAEYKALIWL